MANLNDDEFDDLLDNALEQFTAPAPKPAPKPAAATADKPVDHLAGSTSATAEDITSFEEEFARQLTKGMEDLLKSDAGGSSSETDQMKSTIDQLLKDMASLRTDNSSIPDATTTSSAAAAAAARDVPGETALDEPLSFQDKIKATMDKLKESNAKADAEIPDMFGGDMMEELMQQMDSMGDDSQLDSLVDDVIGQLMSKDMLYQPLKDLDTEYPKYLEKNKDTLSKDDYERYQKQHGYVKEILAMFDQITDGTVNDPRIVDLMQKMQDCGQPPNELLKVLSPDMELDDSGEIKVPEAPNCSIM
ncbi:Peroxisome chaperone and import receptor [Linderina macrospora]|uniref:Peroxisome chaperone and import receptor n=1 Tax=Linderina macrospora TaxID=4868 RepID=A0ACC1JG02_9FUNG|nr:Peroxisome chaperone and import receptor [Linderina macrospora]